MCCGRAALCFTVSRPLLDRQPRLLNRASRYRPNAD